MAVSYHAEGLHFYFFFPPRIWLRFLALKRNYTSFKSVSS